MSQAYPKGFKFNGDPNSMTFSAANFINNDDGNQLSLVNILQAAFYESMKIAQISQDMFNEHAKEIVTINSKLEEYASILDTRIVEQGKSSKKAINPVIDAIK